MPRTATEPPYQRIASALRRRIAAGELRVGQRVPSTREIARAHGVALATAAHALRTLADEGVVRTAPRVGTIVASAGARAGRARDVELTSARIVTVAIAIADAEGIGALSLRSVAAKLGAPVMSLYRHVENKDALLHAMTDAVLGEASLPGVVPEGWRAQLEVAARAQWRVLRRHPWLARMMSITRPRPLPNAIVHAEWVLRALDGHGLDAGERMRLHIVLYSFVQGIAVNLESEAEAIGESGMTDDEWMSTQLDAFAALASSGRFPFFAALLHELDDGFDLDFEVLFERGLSALLDGFARRLSPSR